MRPSFVLCLRKRVVDSLPSVTLVSEVKTLAGLSQEDYKKLPGMITRICNGMSYAEFRHQSIDFQESVVDQINAELKDAGVGTISHEIGRWLVLRNARSRHEYVKEKKLSDDWMNKFTGEHTLDAKTGWGLLLSSIYQVLEDYIEKNQIDGYHLYFSDIPEQERKDLADQIKDLMRVSKLPDVDDELLMIKIRGRTMSRRSHLRKVRKRELAAQADSETTPSEDIRKP